MVKIPFYPAGLSSSVDAGPAAVVGAVIASINDCHPTVM
jgi:hypothetical protein